LGFLDGGEALNLYVADMSKVKKRVNFFQHLRRVRFPNLSCKPGRPCSISGFRRSGHENKGVIQVLKSETYCKDLQIHELIVPDCPDHPHSHQDIENALDGTDVRILDWRKKDISITTLQKVVPNVEVLNLYSSGNQDVLDYWTSYTGLYRFSKVCRAMEYHYSQTQEEESKTNQHPTS
jgi:hypothetical protein